MTLIETLERHRDRLLLETPQTFDGKLALETSIAELEFYIQREKAETLKALRVAQRIAGVEEIQ